MLGRQPILDADHRDPQRIGQAGVAGVAPGGRAHVEAPAVNVEVGGSRPAGAGARDSHRDLALVSSGDALNGLWLGGLLVGAGPGLLQAPGGCRVGLRLITGRCLGGSVESATFPDVSGRALVDQMRQAEFHDVLPSGGGRSGN